MNKQSELLGQLATSMEHYVPQEGAETCILGGYFRARTIFDGSELPCLMGGCITCGRCVFATQNIECVRELSNQLKMLEVLDY